MSIHLLPRIVFYFLDLAPIFDSFRVKKSELDSETKKSESEDFSDSKVGRLSRENRMICENKEEVWLRDDFRVMQFKVTWESFYSSAQNARPNQSTNKRPRLTQLSSGGVFGYDSWRKLIKSGKTFSSLSVAQRNFKCIGLLKLVQFFEKAYNLVGVTSNHEVNWVHEFLTSRSYKQNSENNIIFQKVVSIRNT